MIQRIQSIYLLLVAILMGITVFSPLLQLTDASGSITQIMYSCGIHQGETLVKPLWGVLSVGGLSALMALINIFLFKKRKLQIKVGMFTTFLLLFFYITAAVYFYSYTSRTGLEFMAVYYGTILPFIALILNIMAVSRIRKDEKLVRSLDRIR